MSVNVEMDNIESEGADGCGRKGGKVPMLIQTQE